jgi:hypothetical protein
MQSESIQVIQSAMCSLVIYINTHWVFHRTCIQSRVTLVKKEIDGNTSKSADNELSYGNGSKTSQ